MYLWVVHFWNYFISISERDIETERPEVEVEIVVKVFIYFFYVNNFCK